MEFFRHSFWISLLGIIITAFVTWLIKTILAPKRDFRDFITADSGAFSLSRLQAFLWGFIIISYQVSVFIALCFVNNYSSFSLVFSEEIMWILGITLGTYISVKGIIYYKVETGKEPLPATTEPRKLSDFLSTDGKLSYSRLQMLIWTIFALITFFLSYNHYISLILDPTKLPDGWNNDYSVFFPKFSDDTHIIPTIDYSFVVLMGLSNGAYMGRKLVPDFKVEAFKKENLEYLQQRKTGIEYQQKQLELLLLSNTISDVQKLEIQKKINALKDQAIKIEDEKTTLQKQTV